MKNKITVITALLLFTFLCRAQQKFDGLPDDLDKSKVVFVRLDSAVLQPNAKGWAETSSNRFKQKYNERIPESHSQLVEAAKEYPFEYTIARKSDLPALAQKGYKYYLYMDAFDNLREASPQSHGHTVAMYPVYLVDMNTKDYYVAFELSEDMMYKRIMRFFNKKVKKKYHIK